MMAAMMKVEQPCSARPTMDQATPQKESKIVITSPPPDRGVGNKLRGSLRKKREGDPPIPKYIYVLNKENQWDDDHSEGECSKVTLQQEIASERVTGPPVYEVPTRRSLFCGILPPEAKFEPDFTGVVQQPLSVSDLQPGAGSITPGTLSQSSCGGCSISVGPPSMFPASPSSPTLETVRVLHDHPSHQCCSFSLMRGDSDYDSSRIYNSNYKNTNNYIFPYIPRDEEGLEIPSVLVQEDPRAVLFTEETLSIYRNKLRTLWMFIKADIEDCTKSLRDDINVQLVRRCVLLLFVVFLLCSGYNHPTARVIRSRHMKGKVTPFAKRHYNRKVKRHRMGSLGRKLRRLG